MIRFQADIDRKRIIVDAVRRQEPSIDFRSEQKSRLDGLGDEVATSEVPAIRKVETSSC